MAKRTPFNSVIGAIARKDSIFLIVSPIDSNRKCIDRLLEFIVKKKIKLQDCGAIECGQFKGVVSYGDFCKIYNWLCPDKPKKMKPENVAKHGKILENVVDQLLAQSNERKKQRTA